jgi:hypothetical protein
VQRHPQLSESTVRIVDELCRAVAAGNAAGRQGPRALLARLVAAGKLSLVFDQTMPDWSPGQCWLRQPRQVCDLNHIWRAYRRARDFYSPLLERMLVEAMVCRDLGLGHGDASPPTRSRRGRLLPVVFTGWIGWNALQAGGLAHTAAGFGTAAGIGLGFWCLGSWIVTRRRRGHRIAGLTKTLRALLGPDAPVRPDAVALTRAMVHGAGLGIGWRPDTITVLTYLRASSRACLPVAVLAHPLPA